MGSEISHQRDVQVDKQSVETTDFWTLYNGELLHGTGDGQSATAVSMFQGEPVVKGQLWSTTTPLDRATKNLMVYRHPSILKFLQSSVRGSVTILVTERCRPLAGELAAQSPIQICLGLRSILCALVFLVERAGVRHLNVGLPVVYVTPAGAWRLAGFEQVWKEEEVTVPLLEMSQPFRCRRALDANELRHKGVNLEQYAFGTLCEEVLKTASNTSRQQEADAACIEFLQYCAAHLKHPQATARPTLSSCLQLPYFNHDFITVHSFLTELPLKSAADKQHFFTHLVDRLRRFDERCVAAQLGDLLLARMVLIDGTAQMCVVPHLLSIRPSSGDDPTDDLYDDDCDDDIESAAKRQALFTTATFERFVVPRLVQLFGVRETQTRLILLEYFRCYARCVDERTMRERVLPELLLGIKDSNDVLVAATLRALADLVPLLGASTVIGRNRAQIFADGRPKAGRRDADAGGGALTVATAGDLSAVPSDWIEHRSITPVLMTSKHLSGAAMANGGSGGGLHAAEHLVVDLSESGASTGRSQVLMLERLSPDGGEDDNKTAIDAPELENDAWSDWEADATPVDGHPIVDDATSSQMVQKIRQTETVVPETNRTKTVDTPPEIDYFADMEPVIQKTNVLVLGAGEKSNRLQAARVSSALDAGSDAEAESAGWGDDVDGWGDSS